MGTSNRYSPEVRERAVRLVREQQAEHPSQWAAIESIAASPCSPDGPAGGDRAATADRGTAAQHGRDLQAAQS